MTTVVEYGRPVTVVTYGRSVSVVVAGAPTPVGGGGSGDVVGPSSAVDARIAVFNGTTGKLIADGGAAIADLATAAQGALADTATQPADLASAVANHAAATDPHADRAYTDTQLAGHVAAGDPHPGYQLESQKGAAGGYASLDGSGQIPAAQIPSVAITEYLGEAANEAAMLALSGQYGDWTVRTDTGTVWIITGADPSVLGGWTELTYPAAPVSSVAGRTGAVTLTSVDLTDTTAAGRALLDDADDAAQRTTLGLGDSATKNTGTGSGDVAPGDHSHSGLAAQSQATWEAGVGTDESVVSPAKVAAAIAALGGGGLTHFSESQATISPNATVYVDALAAGGSTTQVDIALIPKGTGAFLLAIPDGTTAGGDKRGANAIDLQTLRSVSTYVASGAGSFAAGVDNRAAGQYSVAIGYSNFASQANGSIAIGYDNDATGQYGSVAIGFQSTATAQSAVALGLQNVASGIVSFATGTRANARSIYGARAHASGRRSADGDRQSIFHMVSATTSSTSATTLTADAGAVNSTNVMVLPNNSGAHFVARVTAYRSGGGVGSWEVCGTIERGANAASTALVGSTTIRTFGASASLGSPVVDVVANTTQGAAVAQVTAGNTDATYWVAKIELIQAA